MALKRTDIRFQTRILTVNKGKCPMLHLSSCGQDSFITHFLHLKCHSLKNKCILLSLGIDR